MKRIDDAAIKEHCGVSDAARDAREAAGVVDGYIKSCR